MIAPSSLPGSPTATAAPVRADLAVHLSSWHVAETVEMARSVLMVLPSVRLRIAHPQPVSAALAAWRDAERLAADTLARSAFCPPSPESTVTARICFSGPVGGAQIDALPARSGPYGTAQVRVRLGALLIIAADRDAVACQLRLWQAAAHHAARLWPTAPSPTMPADAAPAVAAFPSPLARISA